MACPVHSQDLSQDSIVAIATPPGEGGIGILRLSGPKAPEALARLWRGRQRVSEFRSHQMYFGKWTDPESGEVIDSGLVVWMRSPHSYTAEEVVELHAHGGPLVLARLLEALVGLGLRPAEPGEFTRRAFLNGKMDLLQAEAVGEMIQAKSEAALRNARAQLEGRISQEIQELRERLIALLARVEAAIDFPEEDIEIIAPKRTLREIQGIAETLEGWLEKFQLGRLVREGVKLALIGRPNVGKSSLLNLLVGEAKAIVHHQAGTTRDVVEGWMELGGVGFQILDTAGIREGKGEVEVEGILRSRRAAAQADLTLWVLDVSQPLTEEDRQIARDLASKTLVLGNKVDLGITAQAFPPSWSLPKELLGQEWVLVSAKTGEGLGNLKTALLREVGLATWEEKDQAYLNNARHREALRRALDGLERARGALAEGLPSECVAADLREATTALGALLGEVRTEEILDKIFSDFCIGK